MEMSKIKNIVIVILITANVILLVMTGGRARQAESYRQSAVTGVIETLEKNGTVVQPKQLPEETELPVLTIAQDLQNAAERQAEQARVEALIGPCVRQDDGGAGIVVRYRGDQGSAELDSSGQMALALEAGAWPLNGADPIEHGASCLALLGFDGQFIGSAVVPGTDETLALTYRQRWEGVPVFPCQVVLTYEDGQLRGISGRRVTGTATATGGHGTLTVATVLTRFLEGVKASGNVCSEITTVTAGYEFSGVKPLRLVPTWEIVADGQTRYQVDATDGTFRKEG